MDEGSTNRTAFLEAEKGWTILLYKGEIKYFGKC